MSFQLENELFPITVEMSVNKKGIVSSVHVDYWAVKWAIIASNALDAYSQTPLDLGTNGVTLFAVDDAGFTDIVQRRLDSLYWSVLQRFMIYHVADGQYTTDTMGKSTNKIDTKFWHIGYTCIPDIMQLYWWWNVYFREWSSSSNVWRIFAKYEI